MGVPLTFDIAISLMHGKGVAIAIVATIQYHFLALPLRGGKWPSKAVSAIAYKNR